LVQATKAAGTVTQINTGYMVLQALGISSLFVTSFFKKNVMKKIIFPLLLLVLSISCKKDVPAPEPPIDLSGTVFKGPAVFGTISYASFILTFNADATASIKVGGFAPFSGYWNKTPNSSVVYFFFNENDTYKWKGQGTLNAAGNKLEGGILTRLAPSPNSGSFTADKQ
jgi:hypothetical protein